VTADRTARAAGHGHQRDIPRQKSSDAATGEPYRQDVGRPAKCEACRPSRRRATLREHPTAHKTRGGDYHNAGRADAGRAGVNHAAGSPQPRRVYVVAAATMDYTTRRDGNHKDQRRPPSTLRALQRRPSPGRASNTKALLSRDWAASRGHRGL
jgi:hypothetical protein